MAESTPQEERHATEDRFYTCEDSSHTFVLHTRDGVLQWVQFSPQDERVSLADLIRAFQAVGYNLTAQPVQAQAAPAQTRTRSARA